MKRFILVALIGVFILFLNIYNIPMKSTDPFENVDLTPSLNTNNVSIDINSISKVINQTSSKTVDFNQYDTVVVTFWATWCTSCRRENAIVNDIIKNNEYTSTYFIGICVDSDDTAMDRYLAINPLQFDSFNINKDIANLFGNVSVVPTHYIIDMLAKTVTKHIGLLDHKQFLN